MKSSFLRLVSGSSVGADGVGHSIRRSVPQPAHVWITRRSPPGHVLARSWAPKAHSLMASSPAGAGGRPGAHGLTGRTASVLLLTGATGSVGRALLRRLTARGGAALGGPSAGPDQFACGPRGPCAPTRTGRVWAIQWPARRRWDTA